MLPCELSSSSNGSLASFLVHLLVGLRFSRSLTLRRVHKKTFYIPDSAGYTLVSHSLLFIWFSFWYLHVFVRIWQFEPPIHIFLGVRTELSRYRDDVVQERERTT